MPHSLPHDVDSRGPARCEAAVDAGDLGRLTTVRSTTMDPEPPPRDYVAGSGGLYRDCGVHDFDTVRWVTGQEAVEVYATGSDRGAPFFAEVGDVDTATAVITFADGTLGVVSNTRYNGRGHDVRLKVHGSADSIAEACVRSAAEHRPVRVDEVRLQ